MWIFIFVFLFFQPLHAAEELVVQLGRSSNLHPLYLDAFSSDGSLEAEHLAKLETILRYDLQHNGKTEVVSSKETMRALVKKEKGLHNFDAAKWRALSIPYVVKVEIKDKNLVAAGCIAESGQIKGIEGLSLTGKMDEDRRKIHQVADAIYESFFGSKGIAKTHILYTVRTRKGKESNEWKSEVWEMDYDGGNAHRVTGEEKLCVTPVYVPRSGRAKDFLFVSYRSGQPKIFFSSLSGNKNERLTFLRGNQLMPAICPKNNLLAFVSDILGNPEVFVQNFSPSEKLLGKPWQVTSFAKGAQGSPTFSPDGKKIAFVSNKDGNARIYYCPVPEPSQSAKGLKPTLISKINRENTCPAWSPDGKKLAYSAKTKGTRQIWIYDFTTGKETQLTEGAGDKESPSWAPDSQHLVFHSSTSDSSQLYFLHLDQKELVKITSGQGEKRFPVWEST